MTDMPSKSSITIKKYANRRLYNTATSSYVTLEDLSQMVKEGTEFNVYDAKTSEDITRSVLTQIIVEEESKSGQQNLLPIGFLRQLIAFYGDSLQWMVPKYLEQSMQALTGNQDQIRDYFQTTFGNLFPFGSTLEEMSKQNLAMFERTMRLFTPFGAEGEDGASSLASCCTPTASAAYSSYVASEATKTTPMASVTPINKARTEEAKTETATPVAKATPVAVKTEAKTAADPEPVKTPAPVATTPQVDTPMPSVQTATASASTGTDDMQKKIANLQRQLADLAKSRA